MVGEVPLRVTMSSRALASASPPGPGRWWLWASMSALTCFVSAFARHPLSTPAVQYGSTSVPQYLAKLLKCAETKCGISAACAETVCSALAACAKTECSTAFEQIRKLKYNTKKVRKRSAVP
eukprot:1435542-Rhodomonas_salina.2